MISDDELNAIEAHMRQNIYRHGAHDGYTIAITLLAEVRRLRSLVAAAIPHCRCGRIATHSEPWANGAWTCEDHARHRATVFYADAVRAYEGR